MAKRSGTKTIAQTPAPAKDRISGSKVNPKGSASSEKSASQIKFDTKTLTALTNKLKEFKESNPNSKNITLADLKAVYRRGAGAYSTSHRPNITRGGWAMARVNKFLEKASGKQVKKAYVQDDDLMKMHLGGDMSKHLAPNDKPSNLTHEQWHLVRTPEFKAWFGDWENNPESASKVVDENGEPMVVYHSSISETPLEEFDLNKHGYSNAIFFADNLKTIYEQDFGIEGKDKNITSFFIKGNIFDINNPKHIQSLKPFADKNIKIYGEELLDDIEAGHYESIEDENVQKEIKRLGYDGFTTIEGWGMNYGLYDTKNVKLADGTNTTFDTNNPDIRYADGGKVKSEYEKKIKEAIKYVENSPKARMDIDFDEEQNSKEAIKEGKDYKRIFPLKSKSNSFIVKRIREGVENKYDSFGIWNEDKKSFDYKYLDNKKYGDKSREFDTLQIANYDDKGKIVGIIKIATSENKKDDVKMGATKLSVRQDYQNKGIASKLIEKAESEGVDFVEAIKNNNFTSKGRWFILSWLNKKLKNKQRYADGGDVGQEIRCRRCNHKWNTNQSDEHDKYVCHKCGFDNTTYYDKNVLGYKNNIMTDKYEISDYWETESFADGGLVKTKSIITDKIGWNESVADWFIEQDPKLAIWLADGFMKYHLGKNLLPENTSKEFKEKYGIDISNKPKKEEWDSLPMSIKKKLINELYSNSTMFFRYGEIYENTGLTRADNQVRLILDWIKHPITPKQDLKNLSITEALEKAKEWHEELVAIGGDIDFVEPEENEIFITYPKDKDGAEFYWVKIPSNFCSLESSRMGHCGRTGYGNTLISLRSIRPYGKGHTINDSHVTIAYNEKDGIFYQTKGKKNQKPAEKYHDYIFDLVKTLAQYDRHI